MALAGLMLPCAAHPPALRSQHYGCPLLPSLRPSRAQDVRCPLQIVAARINPMQKDWEHYKLNKNGNPITYKMHVKIGDTVKVIRGTDKGKVGSVKELWPKMGVIKVEGVNVRRFYVRKQQQNEKGQTVYEERPIYHSNVMLYSNKEGVTSRVGKHVMDDGTKVRFLRKTGEIIGRKFEGQTVSAKQ